MTHSILRFKSFKSSLLWIFLLAIAVFAACSKDSNPTPIPVDKTALQDSINAAQSLHDGTVEGTKPGQYVVGSKATLQTAIDAANAVLADPNSTQSEVTSATANLSAAMNTYRAQLISEISAANLMGFWKMNGNTSDSSGNARDGTITTGHPYFGAGTPTLIADRFGRANMCYHFDMGGNIDVPYDIALNPQQMTISLWSKKQILGRTLNTDSYYLVAMNRWNGYKLQYQSANKIFFTVKGASGTDTSYYDRDDEVAVLDNDVWYHVVVTFTAGEMDFYINGDLVKSWTNTPFPPVTQTSPVDFVIGQDLPTSDYSTDVNDGNHYVNYGGYFTGDIDDVMFYNIALTGPQIKSIYENQKTL
ncbi:MAG: LamG-like jellyroll fold domain-containing protein [Parafilimonas sp.]